MPTVDEIIAACEREGCCPLALAAYGPDGPVPVERSRPHASAVAGILGVSVYDLLDVCHTWDQLSPRDPDRPIVLRLAVERAVGIGLGPRFETALAKRRER